MSLKSLPIPPVPEETARVARAVFSRGNVVMQLRDTLGAISSDEAFADLFPTHGQPALAPWRLALVTVFQFMEHLTDRQEAFAVGDRLAWKYALSLELCDPGFDHTVLCEFRSRLVEGNAEQRLLDLLLERCREGGWLKARGRQRDFLNPRAGQDPRPQPHAVRGSDHGLRLERALGGRPRLGSCPCASRVGRALWRTARTGTPAKGGGRTQAVRQSSRSRRLDAARCARGCYHCGPYRKRCLPSSRCAPFGSNSLKHGNRGDNGG
jgi:transposase